MKSGLRGKKQSPLSNEDGIAMFEGLVFMVAFVILTIYVIDSFTAIHTGILNSISARTYLFETLEHRSNLRFLRFNNEKDGPNSAYDFYAQDHQRYHAVEDEDEDPADKSIKSAARRLSGVKEKDRGRSMTSSTQANSSNKTDVIYIKEGYGICLDASCPTDPGG